MAKDEAAWEKTREVRIKRQTMSIFEFFDDKKRENDELSMGHS